MSVDGPTHPNLQSLGYRIRCMTHQTVRTRFATTLTNVVYMKEEARPRRPPWAIYLSRTPYPRIVFPAQAGIQLLWDGIGRRYARRLAVWSRLVAGPEVRLRRIVPGLWIPACAGKTSLSRTAASARDG